MRKPARIAVLTVAATSATVAVVSSGSAWSAGSSPQPRAAIALDGRSLWRQTDANPARSRDNAGERVLTPTSIKRARLLRTLQPKLSAPVDDEFCTYPGPDGYAQSPLFEPGGRLFVGTPNSVTEYNPDNGVLKDQIALGPEHNDYLSVARGVLVADGVDCDSASDPSGFAEAHNAITGQPIWHGSPAPDNNEALASVDLVQDGSRLIAAFGSVSAIDLTTGTTQWKQGDCYPYPPPFIAGGNVISETCPVDGNVVTAFDEATGAVLWTRQGSFTPIRADRAAAGGGAQVYAQRADGGFVALSASRGNTLFVLRGATSVVAADGARVYGGCGTDGSDLCAYSKRSGALVWRTRESGDQVRQTGGFSPLVAVGGSVVYVGNGDVLSAATGSSITHLWTGHTATDLAVGDGYVAADIGDGVLRLYGLAGQPRD